MVTCERPTPARTNVTRLSRNAPACRFKLRMNRKSGTRLICSQALSLWPGDGVPGGTATAGHVGTLGSIDAIRLSLWSIVCSVFGAPSHSEVADGIKWRSQRVWRGQPEMCRHCHFNSFFNSAAIDAAVGCCWTIAAILYQLNQFVGHGSQAFSI